MAHKTPVPKNLVVFECEIGKVVSSGECKLILLGFCGVPFHRTRFSN